MIPATSANYGNKQKINDQPALLLVADAYWNDRRLRRVCLCFYSVIFKLTSLKFQTFAYNSKTVRSRYIKFWQQFEINKLCILSNFEAKDHVT